MNPTCDIFLSSPLSSLIFNQNFEDLKRELVRQGQEYAKQAANSRAKIANLALDFIQDDFVVRMYTILTHHTAYLSNRYSPIRTLE